jgi:signal transduction histidine kinase
MSLPLPEPSAEDAQSRSGRQSGAAAVGKAATLRLVAQREYALHSLLELSHDLSVSLGVHDTAEILILNLMGQLGTGRAALWLVTERGQPPVLIRSHGYRRHAVRAVVGACHRPLLAALAATESPVRCEELKGLDDLNRALLKQADLALLAPLKSSDAVGLLALGSRLDKTAYSDVDLHVFEAAVGMLNMSLQNSRLYARLLENNRQLRALNERLVEHDQLKSEFLSNVNHELRTPLTVVIAALECVLEQPGLESVARQLLEVALQKSGDLNGLIETLLTFSDAVHGRLKMDAKPGDIGPILQAFHQERLPGVSEGLRELVVQCDSELPHVHFDSQGLRQILDELLDNALKFTPAGTHLEVRAQRGVEDGFVRVMFSDDGPGIPTERLGALFRSFEQVDGSWTRQAGGIGVGLPFAEQVARLMGGTLEAESEIGKGTTFTLRLPVA